MAFEATTDGEKIMQLSGNIERLDTKIDNVCESLDRVVSALERLETTRLSDHEKRIAELERKENERSGAYKFIMFAITIIGAALAWVTIKITTK